jgi:hypothetical protein
MSYVPIIPGLASAAAPSLDSAWLEMQTLNAFLQDAAAGWIRKLSGYLETNSQKVQTLAAIAPLVGRAADSFRNRDYTAAFAQAYEAYRSIVKLRTVIPDLPDL